MKLNLTVIAKSDKHNGYCVAAVDHRGRIIRLVRDSEGHALRKEQCDFEKLYDIISDVKHAPLKHQTENYILNELLKSQKSGKTIMNLNVRLDKPAQIFSNNNPWLTEAEMRGQKSSFLFVQVSDLRIYKNDEDKYKADFVYGKQKHEGFSITDPEFKTKEYTQSRAVILVSLPDTPYKRYGNELYYKFIAAVYPLKSHKVFSWLDCYKI